MKRIIMILLLCLILTGCHHQTTSKEEQLYQKYISQIKNCHDFETQTDDFRMKLIVNELDHHQLRYDLIIDQPQIVMKNLKVLAIVDGQKGNDFPSLGIVDQAHYSLIPHQYDKKKNIYKGVNLSGITKNKTITLKIYISYKNTKKVERYFILNENETR